MTEARTSDQLADEAIAWFARLRADDVSAADRQRFFAWLKRGSAQQTAFVEILELWEGVAVVSSMDFEDLQEFPPLMVLKRRAEMARP